MPINWRGIHNFLGRVRFGSSGSYINTAADGRQTFVGDARVYKDLWIPAANFFGIEPSQFTMVSPITNTAASPNALPRPLSANFGKDSGSTVQIPALSASAATNTDSRAGATFIAPSDAATTGSVLATLFFTSKVAMATAGSMEVFRLRYQYLGSGSATLAQSGSILYGGSYAGTGNGAIEAWDLGSIDSFAYSASPLVMLELALEQSNGSCMAGSAEELILGLRLRYLSDSHGAQTA